MFLHRVLEFTAGGIFLIAIPLWVEQFIKFGKSRFVHPNAGYGALFIIRILVQSPLERLVSIAIDPMLRPLPVAPYKAESFRAGSPALQNL